MSSEKSPKHPQKDSALDRLSAKLSRPEARLSKIVFNQYRPRMPMHQISAILTTHAHWTLLSPRLQNCTVFAAARACDDKLLEKLGAFGADFNIEGELGLDLGWTPLSAAINPHKPAESVHSLRTLLSFGADANLISSRSYKSPLWRAVDVGHIAAVECLVEHGADANFAPKQAPQAAGSDVRLAPVQLAVDRGKDVLRTLLIKGKGDLHGRVPATGGVSRSLLRYALVQGRKESVNVILDAIEAVDAGERDRLVNPPLSAAFRDEKDTEPPLHTAARFGDVAAFKRLLAMGANPGATDTSGACAVHVVMDSSGAERALPELLETMPDVNLVNDSGFTALHLMAKEGKWALVTMLLHAGADPNLRHEVEGPALEATVAVAREKLKIPLKKGERRDPRVDFVKVIVTLVAHGAEISQGMQLEEVLTKWKERNKENVALLTRNSSCRCRDPKVTFNDIFSDPGPTLRSSAVSYSFADFLSLDWSANYQNYGTADQRNCGDRHSSTPHQSHHGGHYSHHGGHYYGDHSGAHHGSHHGSHHSDHHSGYYGGAGDYGGFSGGGGDYGSSSGGGGDFGGGGGGGDFGGGGGGGF